MHRHPFLLLSAAACLLTGLAAEAQTIHVTTIAETQDFGGAQQVADLPGPDGRVSVREAITAANNTPGPQTIDFMIPASQWGPGEDWPILRLTSSPFVLWDDETTIDCTTQTAFTGDTNPDGPEVEFRNAHPSQAGSPAFSAYSDRNRFIGFGRILNRGYGIWLGETAEENVIQGCQISGPVFAAVRVYGDRNVIGGTGEGEGNDLSSGGSGVTISASLPDVAEGNVVIGNFLHGSSVGAEIVGDATGNRIGGLAPGEANRFSETGHGGEHGYPEGRLIRIEADGNFVLGNLIGTDEAGTGPGEQAAPIGVQLGGTGNTIEGNVFGGIPGVAIMIASEAYDNAILNNAIGVDATRTIPIPNGTGIDVLSWGGLLIDPERNAIEGNVIAHNLYGGVRVHFDARRIRIRGNSIHDNHGNGELGIDLGGQGPTPNDPGDGDTGANDLLNFPVLVDAASDPTATVVTGTLDTPSPETCVIELFGNPPPFPGETVEAEEFLGSVVPAPDGSFTAVLAGGQGGRAITATATDALGNTSEISAAVIASGGTSTAGDEVVLTASDPAQGDHFGYAVAIDGDTVASGAPSEGETGIALRGAVYVHVRSGDAWSEAQKIVAADGAASDGFGFALALDGDTLAIGSPADDDRGANSGSVYVYARSGGVWSLEQKLVASDGTSSDGFGRAVALEGDRLAVGADLAPGIGAGTGAVYVFARSGTSWTEEDKLFATDGVSNDAFGASLALSGDRVLIGAREDDSAGTRAGSAYLFLRDGSGAWNQEQKLTGSDTDGFDQFGAEVALDRDRAVVGAPARVDSGNPGAAYVFRLDGATWVETARLQASDAASGAEFGSGVSFSGGRIAVGARDRQPRAAVYTFRQEGLAWVEEDMLAPDPGPAPHELGRAVDHDADTLVAGAWESWESGAIEAGAAFVRVFEGGFEQYCDASPNSTGLASHASYSGSTSVSANDLVLHADGRPTGSIGVFLHGPNAAQTPFGNGTLCVGGPVVRLGVAVANGSGLASRSVNNLNQPTIVPGASRFFQAWYRNPAGGGAGFNLSDGLRLTFTP